MLHVTWTTFKFKFNKNELGMVSAYAMWLWLIALLMCTFKWLSSIEIQCHKGFHLNPKAAINYTEISSLICHRYWYNGGKHDWRLSSHLIPSNLWSFVLQWNFLESNFSLMIHWARWFLHNTELMTYADTVPSWFLLNLKVIQVTWNIPWAALCFFRHQLSYNEVNFQLMVIYRTCIQHSGY